MWPCGQSTFSRLPTPQRLPCRLPVVSKVKFLSNQRSRFPSRHTLQLPFMSLPGCSSKQPLLVVLYFGGAHLAATFGISPQNCPHLIPHVNLLAVCRSSKQQHFCAAQKHFRTSAGHCGEKLHPNHRPLSLPQSSAHTKNSLFVEICPEERGWREGTGSTAAKVPGMLTASQS